MSIEAISAVDADLARVSAASLQLSAALAQEQTGADAKPGDVERGHAAVQAAEANLEEAQAALAADQSAPATPTAPTPPDAQAASSRGSSVTDPGGIVA